MIFELQAQFITDHATARAERTHLGLIVMTTDGGRQRARGLCQAIQIACQEAGPLMERGDRAGEGWGLMVAVGPVSVAYGNWPGGQQPRRPRPEHDLLRRILAEYRPGDGARGALKNAARVIRAYGDSGVSLEQRAA